MKNYKEKKINLGYSDIAALVLVGYREGVGAVAKMLEFGGDGSYSAYLVDETVDIPAHYSLTAEFNSWLKIYDDDELVAKYTAKNIKLYRAGEFGLIIQIIE